MRTEFIEEKPSESEIIEKSHEDTLYSTSLDKVKIFNIQTLGQVVGQGFQVSPKIRLTLTHENEKDEIRKYKIAKWTSTKDGYKETEKVSFSTFDLVRLI